MHNACGKNMAAAIGASRIDVSLRSRRYSRAQGGKLEIPMGGRYHQKYNACGMNRHKVK